MANNSNIKSLNMRGTEINGFRKFLMLCLLVSVFGSAWPSLSLLAQTESLSPKGAAPLRRGSEKTTIMTSPPKGQTSLGIGSKSEDGVSPVYCANLIYAHDKSSRCFSASFMLEVRERTNIAASNDFSAVELRSEKLFDYPFAVMTGEKSFQLPEEERTNLRDYLLNGGFVVASAGCSNEEWANSFRKEIKQVFPEGELKPIPFSHPIFSTLHEIRSLGDSKVLEGLEIDGRIVVVFSKNGLNDSKAADNDDCCCCGASELNNARQINANLLIYAVTH